MRREEKRGPLKAIYLMKHVSENVSAVSCSKCVMGTMSGEISPPN